MYIYDLYNTITTQTHRWVKRGFTVCPGSYNIAWGPTSAYPAYIAIYASDGTVVVSHGGVEMGQGINIKVSVYLTSILSVLFSPK